MIRNMSLVISKLTDRTNAQHQTLHLKINKSHPNSPLVPENILKSHSKENSETDYLKDQNNM